MFNTCSQGPTHLSLTDTDGGYNLGGVDFLHHTPHPSQPTALRLPSKGLAWSLVYKIPPTNLKFKIKEHMAVTWSSDHTTIYHGLHLCLAKAIGLTLAIGFIMMDQKVILMHVGHQFNSYNLMHIQES
jgi:hypothetical protein